MAAGTFYTGNELASQPSSPAPGPGLVPIVYLTGDDDGGSWANAWQGWRANADHVAHLNKVARLRNPRTPNTATGFTSLNGFTAVAQNGGGTGTIAPALVNTVLSQPTNTPYNFVFKITLAGAVGVARFAVSLDGGATYAADVLTAATYLEPTSGVTVSISGIFNLNTTYSFSATDVPMAAFVDAGGHNFGLVVDHLGNPGGARGEFRETWWGVNATTIASGANAAVGRWQGYCGASGGITAQPHAPDAGYQSPYVVLDPGATSGSQSALGLANGQPVFNPSAGNIVMVLEFDWGWAQNKCTPYMGFSSSLTPWTSGDMLVFSQDGAGALQVLYGPTGSVTVQTITSFALAASTEPNMRSRIEFWGSTSPFGYGVRFFMNGRLIYAAPTTGLPTASMFPFFAGRANAAGNTGVISIGSIYAGWNRWPSAELL